MYKRHEPRRHGFSLIELLVVTAIIAVIIGLLLPAVQKVREAAARAACSNNLHQLAIAVHSYHDANKVFPSNGPDDTHFQAPIGGNYRNWSWLAEILPYVEQGPLYNQLGIPNSTLNANPAAIAQPVKAFLCPSDGAFNGQPRTNAADFGTIPIGQTNYKGVSGSNWTFGNWAAGNSNGYSEGNGIFYRTDGQTPPAPGHGHGPLAMVEITDGTSNTFMIGEDIPELNRWCAWPYANTCTGTCAIPLNNALLEGQPGFGNINNWQNLYSFRSRHINGANFAFADGSVQFINQSIDLTLYRSLSTYAGGEAAARP